jgi:YHS domain-containing protein
VKKSVFLVILATILFAFGSPVAAQQKEMVACSVCGYLIDKDKALTTEYEGTTYYFCEAGCKAYFLMDASAFAAGMDRDPVCGMTVKKQGSVEAVHNGLQLHFCSAACKDKYLVNPAEYEMNYDVVSNELKLQKEMKFSSIFEGRPFFFVSEANKLAFEKNSEAYVYAECPVSGKVFLRKDAGARTEYKGQEYFLCCKNCLAKFNEHPEQYMGPAKTGAGCTGAKEAGEKKIMKEGKGAAADTECPAKKSGACPMAKECKKS